MSDEEPGGHRADQDAGWLAVEALCEYLAGARMSQKEIASRALALCVYRRSPRFHGLTREQIAAKIGITPNALYRLVRELPDALRKKHKC